MRQKLWLTVLAALALGGCQDEGPTGPIGFEGLPTAQFALADGLTELYAQGDAVYGGIYTWSRVPDFPNLQGPVGDDFVVPAGQTWNLTHVALFGLPIEYSQPDYWFTNPLSQFTVHILRRDWNGSGYDPVVVLHSFPGLTATDEPVELPNARQPAYPLSAFRYLLELPGGGVQLTEGTYWLAILGEQFSWAGTENLSGSMAVRFKEDWTVRYPLDNSTGFWPPWDMKFELYQAQQVNTPPVVTSLTLPVDPVPVGTVVYLSSTFTDENTGDTHTATTFWGDGTSSAGTLTESGGSGVLTDTHAYAAPGVYGVRVETLDNHDGSGFATYNYVVVYDPSAGFVTGGGWFISRPGMYRLDPTAEGKATFGFVAKYQKGANVPSGNTEFQFEAAGLSFVSTSYEWLVVTGGDDARFKGSGLINGQLAPNGAEFRFLLSAQDGPFADGIKIRIWWEEEATAVEHEVYLGGSVLVGDYGGGSIVIHTK